MLVNRRVSLPSPSIISPAPIYTPRWREALWHVFVKNTTQWPRPGVGPGCPFRSPAWTLPAIFCWQVLGGSHESSDSFVSQSNVGRRVKRISSWATENQPVKNIIQTTGLGNQYQFATLGKKRNLQTNKNVIENESLFRLSDVARHQGPTRVSINLHGQPVGSWLFPTGNALFPWRAAQD